MRLCFLTTLNFVLPRTSVPPFQNKARLFLFIFGLNDPAMARTTLNISDEEMRFRIEFCHFGIICYFLPD